MDGFVHAFMDAFVDVCFIRACIYKHYCICAFVHLCKHLCIHLCICASICACICALISAFALAFVHAFALAFSHAFVHAFDALWHLCMHISTYLWKFLKDNENIHSYTLPLGIFPLNHKCTHQFPPTPFSYIYCELKFLK